MKNQLSKLNTSFCKYLFSEKAFLLLLPLLSLITVTSDVYILRVYTLLFILIAPGYLIYRIIHKSALPIVLLLSFSLGYSIFYIYLVGLLNIFVIGKITNILPLGKIIFYQTFYVSYFFLFGAWYLITRNRDGNFISLPKIKLKNIASIGITSFLPVLSFFGAILLNNDVTNTISILLYLLVLIIFIYYLWYSDKNDDYPIAWFFFVASLSLVLSYSLRSNYVSGYDISQEFKFFSQTASSLQWLPKEIKDAYQACLSITLLPTAIFNFSPFSKEMVFKLVMASMLAFIPVNLYYVGRIFFSKKIVIASTFFFISQYWYFGQLPTILRQGIGYVFYSLILFTIFSKEEKLKKNISLLLLGTGLVLSHYSTTYIFLTILFVSNIFIFSASKLRLDKIYSKLVLKLKLPLVEKIKMSTDISFITVAFIIAIAYLWYVPITNTFPNLISKFGIDKSEQLNQSYDYYFQKVKNVFLYKFDSTNKTIDINNYLAKQREELHHKRPYLWSAESEWGNVVKDRTKVIPLDYLIQTPYIPFSVVRIIITLFSISRLLLNNIFLPLGIIIVIFLYKKVPWEYNLFSFILLFIIGLITILPAGLGSYNIERVYLQLLMTGSILSMWLFSKILSLIKIRMLVNILFLFVIGIYYLFYTGVAQLFVGGSPLVTLNNFGKDYYKNFTHKSEVTAAVWLKPYIINEFVFADNPGRNRLLAYADANSSKIITPILASTLNNNGYVFLNFHNIQKGIVIIPMNGSDLYLTIPKKTLILNKNLIYNNGSSQIYR